MTAPRWSWQRRKHGRERWEPTEDDDDEPAEKHWRTEDFVVKASMDEMTGTRITDESGILDEDAAGDTWTD